MRGQYSLFLPFSSQCLPVRLSPIPQNRDKLASSEGVMRQKHLFVLLIFVGLVLATAACSTPAPPDLPPDEIVQRSADRMNNLSGFHFRIDRTGAPAYLDPDNTFSFRSAEGDYVSPDRSRALVKVIAPGLVTQVSVVSVGEVQWQTNVLTGQWEELPPDQGFNPTSLFDDNIGLQAILLSDLSDLQLVGTENIEDGAAGLFYVVTGESAGERLFDMSNLLIGPESVQVKLWIAPETFELHRVLVTEPVPGETEPSVWQVDFSNFDEVVEVVPPVGESGQ